MRNNTSSFKRKKGYQILIGLLLLFLLGNGFGGFNHWNFENENQNEEGKEEELKQAEIISKSKKEAATFKELAFLRSERKSINFKENELLEPLTSKNTFNISTFLEKEKKLKRPIPLKKVILSISKSVSLPKSKNRVVEGLKFEDEISDNFNSIDLKGESETENDTLKETKQIVEKAIEIEKNKISKSRKNIPFELGMTSILQSSFSNPFYNHLKIGGGIEGIFTLKNKYQLSLSTTWQQSKVGLSNISNGHYPNDVLQNFPIISTQLTTEWLEKMLIQQKMIEFQIGVDYLFQPNHQSFSPFVGLGLMSRFFYHQSIDYDFLNGNEFSKIEVDFLENIDKVRWQAWSIQVGLEYYIHKNWTLKFGLQYVNDFQSNGIDDEQYQYLGSKISVLYQLRKY